MLIVADSSALVSLAICQCLHLLENIFDEVKVPQAVFDEVIIEGKREAEILRVYLRGKVVTVDLTEFVIDAAGLGRGEIEAMALFKRAHANLLLIDDRRARKVAQLNNIEIVGSLGILLFAKQKNLIKHIKPLLDKIRDSDVHINERLIKKILQLAGEA
ncbi:MAG: DUF3368 domain-containing protein [bacterium]